MAKNEIIEHQAKNIDFYAKYAVLLESLLEKYNIPKDASPLVNFRDAIFHYVKLYESDNDEQMYGNAFAIEEHLGRGIKDILVYLIIEIRSSIERYTDTINFRFKSNSDRLPFVELLNKLSNLKLEIRKNYGKFDQDEIEKLVQELSEILDFMEQIFTKWKINLNIFFRRIGMFE